MAKPWHVAEESYQQKLNLEDSRELDELLSWFVTMYLLCSSP